MKEQFVSYNIAFKLKNLGFDEKCLGFYDIQTKDFVLDNTKDGIAYKFPEIFLAAPLWQQVIDWFREVKLKEIVVWNYYTEGYYYAINGLTNELEQQLQDTFYKAREQAILKALELIKNNK